MDFVREQLEQVGSYFKGLLLKGEYELVEADNYTAKIIIKGLERDYQFRLWIANGVEHFQPYFQDHDSIHWHYKFTSKIDQEAAWEVITPRVQAYIMNELIKQKEKELELIKAGL